MFIKKKVLKRLLNKLVELEEKCDKLETKLTNLKKETYKHILKEKYNTTGEYYNYADEIDDDSDFEDDDE